MQLRTLLLAAVSVTSVLAGTINLKAPKRNKVNLIITRESDDLCCTQGIEDLKDLGACHKCRPWQKLDTSTSSITSDSHAPVITPSVKARDVSMMVDPSRHPYPQLNTTGTPSNTRPGLVFPLCLEGGNVVPARPFPEPWCSNANKHFQCLFCSHASQPPSSANNSLDGDIFEFEVVSDGKSDVTNDMQAKKCCLTFRGFTWCYKCPSATSATEVSLAAATAATVAVRDSDGIKPAQCCFTNGLEVFGCHDCEETPTQCCSTNGLTVFDCHDCDKKKARSVSNEGRAVSKLVTTKVSATATKPSPTLRFPTTLTNLPQVTPSTATTLEKPNDQEECCVHLGEELICHHCPTGVADVTDKYLHHITPLLTPPPILTVYSQAPSTTLSVAKRQQTYDFHMECSWASAEQGHKCNKNKKQKINADMCKSMCQCDNLGSMHCQAPDNDCTDDETLDYCKKGSPFFGCACSHL